MTGGGISINDIFRFSNGGIVSGRDKLCISSSNTLKSLQDFKDNIKRFMDLNIEQARLEFELGVDTRDWKIEYAQKELKDTNNKDENYINILYRPFDVRWTYFTGKSKGFHCMPKGNIMQHMLNNDNLGLIYYRSCENKEINNFFITQNTIDFHLVGSGSIISPLYLKIQNENIENFTPDFRAFINTKYDDDFSPEDILGYIYAILYHKDYRSSFKDFLKMDYPKIIFIDSKDDFIKLSELGSKLINIHLLKNINTPKDIGQPFFKNISNKNEKIDKILYDEDERALYINDSLYFANVTKKILEYKIGGYEVLYKYLKSHKNENIAYNHFENIIKALYATINIQDQIAQIKIL